MGDYELICVDDGSTDDSLKILEEYRTVDERIKIISQENAGPAEARNAGLDLAKGDYVILLDSDDIFDIQLFEKFLKKAEENNADVVVCRSSMFDHATKKETASPWTVKKDQIPTKNVFSCSDMYDTIFTAFVGWPWDKFYKRSFIEEHNLRFPALKNSEDLLFVFMSLVCAERIVILDEELIKHRMNRGGSVSNSRISNSEDFYKAICMLHDAIENLPYYQKLDWGFRNWAFDYTLWNAETLPDGPVRNRVLDRLSQGGYCKLALDDHGLLYYSLVPDVEYRIKKLYGAFDGAERVEAHPSIRYAVKFFSEVQHAGWICAFLQFAKWVIGRSGSTPEGEITDCVGVYLRELGR